MTEEDELRRKMLDNIRNNKNYVDLIKRLGENYDMLARYESTKAELSKELLLMVNGNGDDFDTVVEAFSISTKALDTNSVY